MKKLLLAILPVLFAFLIQQYFYIKQNEFLWIDMHTEINENYLSQPNFPNSNVEIKVDGDSKTNLSLITVSFFNYSNKNITDTTLDLKITPQRYDDFNVITHYAVGEKNIPNLIRESRPVTETGKSIIFHYDIDFINRTDKVDYNIQLKLLYEGTSEINIESVIPGARVRNYDKSNMPYNKIVNIQSTLILILFLLAIISLSLISSFIYSKFSNKSRIKTLKKYVMNIYSEMRKDDFYSELSDEVLKDHCATILFNRDIKNWNNKNKFSKFLDGNNKPTFSDYS